MPRKAVIFDANWIRQAQATASKKSWAHDAIEALDTTGGIYLSSLRLWFNEFPLKPKQKQALAARLESTKNEDHLGGVNELAWWAFLQKEQFHVNPIPPAKSSTPDFWVTAPSEFFVEVSTLNVSNQDKAKFEAREAAGLDHTETLRRILGKFTNEKQQQLLYAADQKKPGALVLFDYTTWSALGTQFYRFLGDFLLGKQCGFQGLPAELSALVYVERKCINGHIGISRLRSATYYNPNAKYALPLGTFTSLNQFWSQMVTTESVPTDYWVWL